MVLKSSSICGHLCVCAKRVSHLAYGGLLYMQDQVVYVATHVDTEKNQNYGALEPVWETQIIIYPDYK